MEDKPAEPAKLDEVPFLCHQQGPRRTSTGPAGAGSPQNPEALPERGAARRLNPQTPGLATEETGSAGACKPLNPGPTPGSGAARKLIPPRPENSLEAPDTSGVCTTLTAGATVVSGAPLKLTPSKPEKSEEEPETAEDWTPLPPRARLGRGAAHNLTPPSPVNSVEGPETAGEGTPLAIGCRAESGAARKLTPQTANSGAGLRTEGACPPLTPGAKPGRGDIPRLTPLLPAATTEGSELGGDWCTTTPCTNLRGRRILALPSANPENAEPEARGSKTADNWPIEAFIAARSASTATNLLAEEASEASSCRRECFSHWNRQTTGLFLLLSRALLSIHHIRLELEKGEVGTLATLVFG
ncbi:hypothetical protein E2C01_042155 [Portunus trituberculatus]|uniref:Uncharacterized protein n=1 Tax=Portunus trituberculatus TaxID=210409 RepID=A0A5B7FVP4_PORTR|nr:hypothetical protein [Portunus trituberculatus]